MAKRNIPKAIRKLTVPTKKEKRKYDPRRQVEGLKKRLDASGIDSEKVTDNRNFIEKALNLTPDQNALFDLFELLDRPQRALFGAIHALQKGEDVGEAIIAGLTRKDGTAVTFKDILHEAGMEDSEGSFGLDDIVGFAGEIFLDPMNLPIIPVKGGGELAEAAAKGLKEANTALEIAQKTGDAAKIAKAAKDVADAKKAVDIAANTTRFISGSDVVMGGLKRGFKGAAKLTDKGITALLEKIDAISANSAEAAKALGKTKEALELANSYNNFKQGMVKIFDAAKALPAGIWERARRVTGAENLAEAQLEILNSKMNQEITEAARKLGVTPEELGKDIQSAIEMKFYRPKGTLFEAVKNPKQPLNEAMLKQITPLMKDAGIKVSDVYTRVTLDNGVEAFVVKNKEMHNVFVKYLEGNEHVLRNVVKPEIIKGDKASKALLKEYEKKLELSKALFSEIDMPRFYSKAEIDRINNLYDSNDIFRNIVDRSMELQKSMLETLDAAFDALTEGYGTKFATATPEGFVRHATTQEYRDIPRQVKPYYDEFAGSRLRGNVDTFTGRTYPMSAEEANMIARAHIDTALKYGDLSAGAKEFWRNQSNIKMFEETIQKSTADFIAVAPRFSKDVKMLDEVLAKGFISDPNIIRPLGVGEKIPRGYTRVTKTDLSNKLKGMSKYVENPDVMLSALKNLPDSPELLIDNNVFEMIGRLGEPKEANIVVRVLDAINNLFKKNKLLSPGFQMRNFAGNLSNMYLAGVPINDILPNFAKADKILRKGEELLMKETLGEVISSADKKILDLYKEFIQNGFHKTSGKLWEIPEEILKKSPEKEHIFREIQKLNNAANEAIDKRFRLALLMYAKENPDIYRKVGIESPAAFVRYVLFDPEDLSAVERNTLRKIIPFYTFAKKNLAFQLKNFTDNPVRYRRLQKAISSLWDIEGIDVKDIESYKRENFWIPIPGLSKDGKYVALKTNLPLGDLAEFADSPLRRVVSSLSPAIRAPFELTANRQMFTNLPIQEFKGQKGYIIPELTRRQEYLLSQTGLDVPVATGADIIRGIRNLAKNQIESPFDFIDQTVGRSLFSTGDVEKAAIARAYDEIRRIEGLMKYYKQEGIDIKTIRDIQNENKQLNSALKRLRSLVNRARN